MIHLWDQKLKEYFNTNLALDREADAIRKELMSQVSHSNLFLEVDTDANGFLTINEFANAIQKVNKPFQWESLRRMIKQYDKCGFFSLNQKDFEVFFHFNGQDAKLNDAPIKEVNDDNFALFIDLVLKEIEISRTLHALAEDIKMTKEFITYEAFRSIAGFDKYINETNLHAYFTAKGIEVKDKAELTKLMYRYDKNRDGCFGYNEFKDIFSPFSGNENANAMYSPRKEKALMRASTSPLKKSPMNFSNDSNAFAKADTNYMSQSKIGGLIYDYSFDEKMPEESQTQKAIPKSNLSPLTNPFKKSSNNYLSSSKPKHDNSPLEIKDNSACDLPSSNSMLNNSFINLSMSQNIGQAQPWMNKKVKDSQALLQSYSQQSPCQDNKGSFLLNSQNNYNVPKLKKLGEYLSHRISLNDNKQYILDYFNEVIVQELNFESKKEEFMRSNVALADLFAFLNCSNAMKISLNDFREGLKKLSIIVTPQELSLLYKRYDYEDDGFLDYREFIQMLLPKKRKGEMSFIRQRSQYEHKELHAGMISLLSNLLYSCISCVKAIDRKREEIASYPSFSNVECFDLIKDKHSRSICQQDIAAFYENHQLQLTSYELELLMDYFDRDKDSLISFNEFAKESAPNEI